MSTNNNNSLLPSFPQVRDLGFLDSYLPRDTWRTRLSCVSRYGLRKMSREELLKKCSTKDNPMTIAGLKAWYESANARLVEASENGRKGEVDSLLEEVAKEVAA